MQVTVSVFAKYAQSNSNMRVGRIAKNYAYECLATAVWFDVSSTAMIQHGKG